ncbi:MFS general substrate transporter [Penicillium odoratum]|uniref:MFS general substrate transporter n=1 Tax=Penicillium odoratum TaxID=1167516 RepID=UPI00254920F3|nr:MFS general substrate transporter [Penicillium odoratum]KAJ5776815.1 MFS general substrate transporter [Penicillium odoratum]
MVGLCFVSAISVNTPLILAVVNSNFAGFTKISTISVAVFAAYCVGNIAGPQFFLASQEPTYDTSIRASFCGLALGILFLALLAAHYMWQNKRRDTEQGQATEGN